jgi:hypothetical protein
MQPNAHNPQLIPAALAVAKNFQRGFDSAQLRTAQIRHVTSNEYIQSADTIAFEVCCPNYKNPTIIVNTKTRRVSCPNFDAAASY